MIGTYLVNLSDDRNCVWQDMAAMRPCTAAADSMGMKSLQHVVESLETRLQSALMQAVMQILESLGKDAATRVAMAERKASAMEQEHINIKQQALSMLLRTKHRSDSMVRCSSKRHYSPEVCKFIV